MARTDEAVGVGGTGASEWSEPTKSSSMEFKNFIPEARGERAADEYERERDEEASTEPELTPSGDVPMPDVLLDDPESYVVDDPEELALAGRRMSDVAPRKKRGRKKGQKADPKAIAVRKAAFGSPVSADEIQKLAAQYGGLESEEPVPSSGPSPAELSAIEHEEGDYRPRTTRGMAGSASDVQAVLAKQARARKRDPRSLKPAPSGRRNPALGYRPDPNAPSHRWPEYSSFSGDWYPWTPEKAGFIKDEPGMELTPDELDLLSRHYELEDEKAKSQSLRDFTKDADEPLPEDEQEHPQGAYVYDDPAVFQQMQPSMASLLQDQGVDPNSGTFMRLSRKFKAPKAPAVLDPESSEFSAEKYFEYVYKMMSHQASRLIPFGQKREWTFFFPENLEAGDINGAWVFNPGLHEWQQITPEMQEEAAASNQERKVERDTEKQQALPQQKWWEREVDPQGEWVDVAGLDPTQAADAGLEEPVGGVSLSGKEDAFTPPEEEERWQPHPDYPGRYWDPTTGELFGYRPGASNWQKQQMAKGVKVSDLPTHGMYDIDPEEKEELGQFYKNIYGEGFEMKIGEFFGLIKEAHGERAERQGHGLGNREMNKRKKEYGSGPGPMDKGPDVDDLGGEEPMDDFGDELEGGDMFQNRDTGDHAFISSGDPTSSQENPEHADFPGAEGGPVDAPPGVFQGSEGEGGEESGEYEGFGPMDAPMDDNEEDYTAGGPEDPEVAGLLPDPDFGNEQSGDEPPEMKKSSANVQLPDYEYQKHSGQRGKQPSPEAQSRRPRGWGF